MVESAQKEKRLNERSRSPARFSCERLSPRPAKIKRQAHQNPALLNVSPGIQLMGAAEALANYLPERGRCAMHAALKYLQTPTVLQPLVAEQPKEAYLAINSPAEHFTTMHR